MGGAPAVGEGKKIVSKPADVRKSENEGKSNKNTNPGNGYDELRNLIFWGEFWERIERGVRSE
jgi:hypothetical protein